MAKEKFERPIAGNSAISIANFKKDDAHIAKNCDENGKVKKDVVVREALFRAAEAIVNLKAACEYAGDDFEKRLNVAKGDEITKHIRIKEAIAKIRKDLQLDELKEGDLEKDVLDL